MDEDSEAVAHVKGLINAALDELREVQSEEEHAESDFEARQERYVQTCFKLKKDKDALVRKIAEHRGIILILNK
jgi:hypothetical protein